MSKTVYAWWPYALNVLGQYPHLCKKIAKGEHLSPGRWREYKAVRSLIEDLASDPDGADKLRLLKMKHWDKTHVIAGAAQVLCVSETTCANWHRQLVYSVGIRLGLEG